MTTHTYSNPLSNEDLPPYIRNAVQLATDQSGYGLMLHQAEEGEIPNHISFPERTRPFADAAYIPEHLAHAALSATTKVLGFYNEGEHAMRPRAAIRSLPSDLETELAWKSQDRTLEDVRSTSKRLVTYTLDRIWQTPLNMLTEEWIYNSYPQHRSTQSSYLQQLNEVTEHTPWAGGLDSLPDALRRAYTTMDAAEGMHAADLLGKPVPGWAEGSAEYADASALLNAMPRWSGWFALSARLSTDAFASKLDFLDWYEWQ